MCRRRLGPAFAAALLLAFCAGASAQASRFDGRWAVTMNCPPHDDAEDDAKGYSHQLVGQVVDGLLTATRGTEGEPGWHRLKGKVQATGDATLRLEGVVSNPKYAIKDAPRGKAYVYRVKAHFEENAGTGERLTGRVCQFRFTRAG